MTVTRGTSNGNVRGSSYQRHRRREYLVLTYRADVDLDRSVEAGIVEAVMIPLRIWMLNGVPLGQGAPACRCYRCGYLLTVHTVTADRIIPGCKGGTYARSNIRPCCVRCNSVTGGGLRGQP